jgi:hypothetical protein
VQTGTTKLEGFWQAVEEGSKAFGDKKGILKKDLVAIISERFGISRYTRCSYISLLEDLEWIKSANSGRAYFLTREQDEEES